MASGIWTGAVSNAWNNTSNWTAAFPNALTDTATFNLDIPSDTTITMGQAISVGSINFSDNNASGSAWLIAPGGAFTLTLGTSTITTTTNATISAAVGGTAAITKAGNATLTLSGGGTNTGTWAVNAGTLAVTTAALTGASGAITVASTGTLTSTAAINKPVVIQASSVGNVFVLGGAATLSVSGTATTSGTTTGAVTLVSGGTYTSNGNIGALTAPSGSTAAINGNTGNITYSGTGLTLGSGTSSGTAFRIADTAGVKTTLTLPSGRTISTSGSSSFYIGSAATLTSIWHNGATLSLSNNVGGSSPNYIGGVDSATAYTYYKGDSGSAASTNVAGSLYFGALIATGAYGGPLITDFSGVTLSAQTYLGFGASTSGDCVHTISSGAHTANSVILGYSFSAAQAMTRIGVPYVFSITGPTTTLTAAASTLLGSNNRTSTYQINVSNGALLSMFTFSNLGSGTTNIYLNSGKLAFNAAANTNAANVFLSGTSNEISVASATTALFPHILTDVTGSGVTSIPLTSGGSGYFGAPYVVITGDGSGATAKADWDPATGSITGITITNPGTGYTLAPTVTLSLGTASSSPPTVAAVINQAGVTIGTNPLVNSFTKTTTGTLQLTGTNVNTGTYNVTGGTLSVGNNSASGTIGFNNTSPVAIGTGTTLNFNRNDSPIYSNLISGLGGISKTSGATPTFTTLSTANTFQGPVTVTAGALRATHADAVGTGSGAIAVASGASFEIAGGITLNSNRGVTIAGTGLGTLGALRNVSGTNTISGALAVTGASPTIGSDAGTLTLSSIATTALGANALSLIGAGDIDLSPVFSGTATVTKTSGVGVAILRGNSTYTGVTTVSAGRLGYTTNLPSVAAGSSSFGNAVSAIAVASGAGIRYYGTGSVTVSRAISFQGGAATTNYLESNGTGAVTHTIAPTYATLSVAKILGLGGTGTGNNTISYAIINNVGANAVSVSKTGVGKWVLSNTGNTYTGNTTVNEGTLVASSPTGTARFGSANTVTVNANGTIQTLTAGGQNGQHTYNNLTFAAGGRIRIGG